MIDLNVQQAPHVDSYTCNEDPTFRISASTSFLVLCSLVHWVIYDLMQVARVSAAGYSTHTNAKEAPIIVYREVCMLGKIFMLR